MHGRAVLSSQLLPHSLPCLLHLLPPHHSPISPRPPSSFLFLRLSFSSTRLHVHICFSLSLNPYCIIPYSPFSCSGCVSQQSLIPVSPSSASASMKHETLFCPFIPPLPLLGFLCPCCPISKPQILLSLSLSLASFPSQRLIHSRMALFPPRPSDNIKIQNGQLNPSSISDLIVMVLPPVPGRPLPPHQPSLYDTKWPGYNFSIYSKNSVNNSFGMRRLHSLGRLQPGLSPLSS